MVLSDIITVNAEGNSGSNRSTARHTRRAIATSVLPRAVPLPYCGLHYAVHGLEGRGMVFRAALSLRRGAAIGPRAPSPLHQDVAARTGFRQLDTWEMPPCQPRTSNSLSRPVQRCCAGSTYSPLRS